MPDNKFKTCIIDGQEQYDIIAASRQDHLTDARSIRFPGSLLSFVDIEMSEITPLFSEMNNGLKCLPEEHSSEPVDKILRALDALADHHIYFEVFRQEWTDRIVPYQSTGSLQKIWQQETQHKKSIDSKKGTFTVDGEGYTWSGIEEAAERYYDSLANLAYETKYDMYPDHFGFIRLATETTRNFVLLTDGWFYTDNRNDEYKADLYNGETFVEGVEVVDKARDDAHWNGDGFIDTYEAEIGRAHV